MKSDRNQTDPTVLLLAAVYVIRSVDQGRMPRGKAVPMSLDLISLAIENLDQRLPDAA